MSKNKYRASSSTTTAFPLDFPAVSVAEIVEDDFPPLPTYNCYTDDPNNNTINELPLCESEQQQQQEQHQQKPHKYHSVHTRCDLCGLIIGFRRTVVACFHCTRPVCSYCANVLGIPGAVKTISVAASPLLQTVSSRLRASPSVSIGRGGTVGGVHVGDPFEDHLPNYMTVLGPTPTPRASVSRTATVRATGRSTTPPPTSVSSPAPSPPRTAAVRPADNKSEALLVSGATDSDINNNTFTTNSKKVLLSGGPSLEEDTPEDREGGETLQPLLDSADGTTTTLSQHYNNNGNKKDKQVGEMKKEQEKSNMAAATTTTTTSCFDGDEAKSSGIFISNDENPLRTGIIGADQYFSSNNNDTINFTKTAAETEKKRGARNMFMSSGGSGSSSSDDDGELPSPSRNHNNHAEAMSNPNLAHDPSTLPTTEEIVNRPVDDLDNPFTNPIRRNLRRFKHIDVNISSGIIGLETTYRTSNGRDADHGEYIKKFVPRDAVFRTQHKKRKKKNNNRSEDYGDVDNDDDNDDFTQSFSGGVVSSGGLPKISTDSNYGDSSQEGENDEYRDSILPSAAPSKRDGVNSKNDNLAKKTKQASATIVLPTDTDAISFAANNTPNHLSFTSNSTTTSNSKNIAKILPSVLESVGISASQQQQNTTAGTTQQQKQQHMANSSDFNNNSVSSSNFLKRQMTLLAQSHKTTDLLNELSSQQHHGAHAEPLSALKWALGSLSTATLTPNVQRVFADALSTRRCQLRNSGTLLSNGNGMPCDALSVKEVDGRESGETPRDCEGMTPWTNGADPAIPFISMIPFASQHQQQGGTMLTSQQSGSFSQSPSTSHSPLNSMINRNHSGGNLTTQRHTSLAARPPLSLSSTTTATMMTPLAVSCHIAKFWCGECDLKAPQVYTNTNHSQTTPAGHTNAGCSQKTLQENREEGQRDASPSPAPFSSFRHRVGDDPLLPQAHFALAGGDNDLLFECRRYPTVAITDPSDTTFVPFCSLQNHHRRSASHPHIPSTHSSFAHSVEDMMSNRSNNMSLASNPPLGGAYVVSGSGSSGHTAKGSSVGGPNSKIASSSGGSSSSGGGGGVFPPVYPPQHLFTAGANVVDNSNNLQNNCNTPTGTDTDTSSRPSRSLPRTASAVYIPGAVVATSTGTTSPKIATPTTPVCSTEHTTVAADDKFNHSYGRQPNAAHSTASPSPTASHQREHLSPSSSSQIKCQLCNKKFGGGPFGSLFGGKKCTCDVCQRTICEGKCGKSVVRELDSLPEDVQRHLAGFKSGSKFGQATASSSSSLASPTTQTSSNSPKSALSQSASHVSSAARSQGQGQGKAAVGTPSSPSSSASPSRSRREGVVKLTMCNMCMLGQ